jgi:hypothetical protein
MSLLGAFSAFGSSVDIFCERDETSAKIARRFRKMARR